MYHKFNFLLGSDTGKKDILNRAADDVAKLLAAAATYDPFHHTKWLGNLISAEDVKAYTGRMIKFITEVQTTFGTGSSEGAGGGSFAFCDAEKYRGKVAFGTDYSSTWKKQCIIVMGWNFFSPKVYRGERALTLIHEVTHLALATTDEKLARSSGPEVDCYGSDYCLELVTTAADRAKKNAENWAYYFAAYRDGLGWSAEDAKYLAPDECAAIRGKRSF